jgi:signal transduction histidine kinase
VDTVVDRGNHRLPGDPDRLERVVHHLLRNAANALPDGGTVVVTLVTDSDRLTVDVADNGIGMSAAEVGQTFRPFWRADRLDAAGPVLASVSFGRSSRSIAAALCARSAGIGLGSTFTFTLPTRRA